MKLKNIRVGMQVQIKSGDQDACRFAGKVGTVAVVDYEDGSAGVKLPAHEFVWVYAESLRRAK